MDDLVPPPPYTPRDPHTPASSGRASPIADSLHIRTAESDSTNGPSHDYSAYEQVSAGTLQDPSELEEEELPSYESTSYLRSLGPPRRRADSTRVRVIRDGTSSAQDGRTSNQPRAPSHSVSITASPNPFTPQGATMSPTSSTSSESRVPSMPTTCVRETMQSAPYGLSALQRVMDLARQLSERPTEQLARSVPPMFTPRQRCRGRPSAIRGTSSCSTSSTEDPLSGADFRDLEDLDLTNLRISLAGLMRDPRNKDEILLAVKQLREDLQSRRDKTLLKQQVREFEAEVHANRKKVKAMRKEAKAVHKAECRERRLEKRAGKRAMKAGLNAAN